MQPGGVVQINDWKTKKHKIQSEYIYLHWKWMQINTIKMTGIFYQKRILVIEDEEDIRKNIADILQSEGYRVLSAANGHEGIEMAAQELPDLILCDILMPDINGFEV